MVWYMRARVVLNMFVGRGGVQNVSCYHGSIVGSEVVQLVKAPEREITLFYDSVI
jgi:hypothetical protein